jgi:hypothetical protein
MLRAAVPCMRGRVSLMTKVPDERLIYGCVGADRPEAEPFIDEVDGILVYTCLECREKLAELLGHRRPTE